MTDLNDDGILNYPMSISRCAAAVNGQPSIITVSFDKEMRVSKIADPDKIIDYLTAKNNICEIHDALILGIRLFL